MIHRILVKYRTYFKEYIETLKIFHPCLFDLMKLCRNIALLLNYTLKLCTDIVLVLNDTLKLCRDISVVLNNIIS